MTIDQTICSADSIAPVVEVTAAECLEAMEKIATAAKIRLGRGAADTASVMGAGNAFNDPKVGRNLASIQDQEIRASYELAHEPLIARVKTRSDSGKEAIYYFARNFTLSAPGIQLTSYNSGAPIGRLAAMDIGDEFELPNGEEVSVIEKGTYAPIYSQQGWDGINNLIAHESFEQVAVESLLSVCKHRLLGSTALDPFAMFNQEVTWTHPRRAALSGTGLRDQSLMNKVQDGIFRLPINRQVMLEGPPGTGKTTTLIKRLSQKLVLSQDRPEDYEVITQNQLTPDHRDSWIMFSPTELLEQYLREAFARDNVPASQKKIQTWMGFRNDIATRVLGLLRSGSRKTGFQREEGVSWLSPHALTNQPGLHAAFDATQRDLYLAELDVALSALSDSDEVKLQQVAHRIRSRLNPVLSASILSIYLEVDSNSDEMRSWATATREVLSEEVSRHIDTIGRRRATDLGALQQIVARIDSIVGDEELDEDEEGIEPEIRPNNMGERIRQMLRASIRAMAVARWQARQVPRNSKFRLVIDWLGEDAIPADDLARMGRLHGLISAVNMVALTTRNYFARLPQRYRVFRKAAPTPWFLPQAAEAVKLTYDELDLLVAIHLEGATELLASPRVRANLDKGNLQALAPLLAEFRNQVVVDEATDFSPLQLRAMACLATPGIRSFFACGDFNQRLNPHGVSQREALLWAVPGLEFRQVETAYRQSRELRDFANRVVELAGGKLFETVIDGPRKAEGYEPVVHVSAEGSSGQSRWIAGRIVEISKLHLDLPSIAVFVPSESQIREVADELRDALRDTNIEVMPCPGGQVLGRENHVRIFAVEHIKGLEFEAAFFHSVQELAHDMPDLFDKFLYVGATRAATFLGIACAGQLPLLLQKATQGLADNWAERTEQ